MVIKLFKPLFITFSLLVIACSNSEYTDVSAVDNCAFNTSPITQTSSSQSSDNSTQPQPNSTPHTLNNDECLITQEPEYVPLNDSEYPYIGIPRIVIETEKGQAIKDKETEIPAKLQVWGKDSPESDVLRLTIKGRGNTTWKFAKKPYAIKFENKESFLGMPEAKKWVFLANYRDRTLMRNSIAFELARKTSLVWTPNGKFVELFLNGKYLGNYFVCEKIEVKKNRLELSKKSYLLEFDVHYDEKYKFRTSINDLPVNIKYPNDIDSSSLNYIQDFIDSTERVLQQDAEDTEYQKS